MARSKELYEVELRRPFDAPWTASRCSRVLRQLQTLLRKMERWHRDRESDVGSSDGQNDVEKVYDPTKTVPKRRLRGRVSAKYGAQKRSGLAPATPKCKGRATRVPGTPQAQTPGTVMKPAVDYSLSARCPKVISLLDQYGDQIQTKIPKNTKKNRHSTGRSLEQCTHKDVFPYFSFDLTQRNMMSSSSYEYIALDIQEVFTKFLVNTSASDGPVTWRSMTSRGERGCRSLRSLCLKVIATETVEDQSVYEEENDQLDAHELFVDVLHDLEQHFGHDKAGWPLLRNVTRFYGIAAVCRSIRLGFLRQNVARELIVGLFKNPMLVDAGEALIQDGLIDIQPVVSPTSTHGDLFHCRQMTAFLALSQYKHDMVDAHRISFKFAMISKTLQSIERPLPLAWICHGAIVQTAVRACLESCAAAELLANFVLSACVSRSEEDRTKLSETRNGIDDAGVKPKSGTVTAEVAVCLVSGVSDMLRVAMMYNRARISNMLSLLSVRILVVLEDTSPLELSASQQHIVGHVLFACLAAGCLDDAHTRLIQRVKPYLAGLMNIPQNGRKLYTSLVRTLARIGIMYNANERQAMFQDLIRGLLDCSLQGVDVDCKQLLAGIACDAAMEVAGCSGSRDLINWATQLQDHRRPGNFSDGQALVDKTTMGTQFRWDADVDEWVAKTPAKQSANERSSANRVNHQPTTMAIRSWSAERSVAARASNDARQKRKPEASDWEDCQDGDFVFKKRPSLQSDCNTLRSPVAMVGQGITTRVTAEIKDEAVAAAPSVSLDVSESSADELHFGDET